MALARLENPSNTATAAADAADAAAADDGGGNNSEGPAVWPSACALGVPTLHKALDTECRLARAVARWCTGGHAQRCVRACVRVCVILMCCIYLRCDFDGVCVRALFFGRNLQRSASPWTERDTTPSARCVV